MNIALKEVSFFTGEGGEEALEMLKVLQIFSDPPVVWVKFSYPPLPEVLPRVLQNLSDSPFHNKNGQIRRYLKKYHCFILMILLMATDTDRLSCNLNWLIAGPYNTIRTTFFNFCRKSSISQVTVVLASEILKIWWNFYPVLSLNSLEADKRFVNIRTMDQTMCRSCKKVVIVWKMLMAYNKRFTNRVTRSILEIRSPHFYARPSQARAVRKRSGFVFPNKDRVTWLVNR